MFLSRLMFVHGVLGGIQKASASAELRFSWLCKQFQLTPMPAWNRLRTTHAISPLGGGCILRIKLSIALPVAWLLPLRLEQIQFVGGGGRHAQDFQGFGFRRTAIRERFCVFGKLGASGQRCPRRCVANRRGFHCSGALYGNALEAYRFQATLPSDPERLFSKACNCPECHRLH